MHWHGSNWHAANWFASNWHQGINANPNPERGWWAAYWWRAGWWRSNWWHGPVAIPASGDSVGRDGASVTGGNRMRDLGLPHGSSAAQRGLKPWRDYEREVEERERQRRLERDDNSLLMDWDWN